MTSESTSRAGDAPPPASPLSQQSAAARALAQVEATREDPAGRLDLVTTTYRDAHGDVRHLLPFRRAAASFMRWQVNRGVLNPMDADPPGSRWWRAVNERLLRDGYEGVARCAGCGGPPSSATIDLWTAFVIRPTARTWYRAHNASIVAAYVEHHDLSLTEGKVERFFMNVVLLRVLYAHALVAAPRLSLGPLAPLGGALGDPRLGAAGAFLALARVLPDRYPAGAGMDTYLSEENRLGRLLDYGVIASRLQPLYEWSATELAQPGLLDLIRDGSPIYAWPFAERRVWNPEHTSIAVRLLRRATSPRRADSLR
jgi:hypothetical protein